MSNSAPQTVKDWYLPFLCDEKAATDKGTMYFQVLDSLINLEEPDKPKGKTDPALNIIVPATSYNDSKYSSLVGYPHPELLSVLFAIGQHHGAMDKPRKVGTTIAATPNAKRLYATVLKFYNDMPENVQAFYKTFVGIVDSAARNANLVQPDEWANVDINTARLVLFDVSKDAVTTGNITNLAAYLNSVINDLASMQTAMLALSKKTLDNAADKKIREESNIFGTILPEIMTSCEAKSNILRYVYIHGLHETTLAYNTANFPTKLSLDFENAISTFISRQIAMDKLTKKKIQITDIAVGAKFYYENDEIVHVDQTGKEVTRMTRDEFLKKVSFSDMYPNIGLDINKDKAKQYFKACIETGQCEKVRDEDLFRPITTKELEQGLFTPIKVVLFLTQIGVKSITDGNVTKLDLEDFKKTNVTTRAIVNPETHITETLRNNIIKMINWINKEHLLLLNPDKKVSSLLYKHREATGTSRALGLQMFNRASGYGMSGPASLHTKLAVGTGIFRQIGGCKQMLSPQIPDFTSRYFMFNPVKHMLSSMISSYGKSSGNILEESCAEQYQAQYEKLMTKLANKGKGLSSYEKHKFEKVFKDLAASEEEAKKLLIDLHARGVASNVLGIQNGGNKYKPRELKLKYYLNKLSRRSTYLLHNFAKIVSLAKL